MKILFISLGCDKNLADSEEMLGLLTGNGHEIVDSEEEADAIVINTCCFIHDAKEESVNTILEMAEYKKTGTCKILIVTGCMAQRYKEEITKEIPEVDAVLGTTSYGDIVKALNEAEAGHVFQEFKDINALPEDSGRRVITTGGHFGYLKIAEGCDKDNNRKTQPHSSQGQRPHIFNMSDINSIHNIIQQVNKLSCNRRKRQ